MHTIKINNSELESFISAQYGNDETTLLHDFVKFIKTELIANDIKKALDEVELFEKGQTPLTSANDFLNELKHEH